MTSEKRRHVALRIEVDMAIFTAHLGFIDRAKSLLKQRGIFDEEAITRLLTDPSHRRHRINDYILSTGVTSRH